MKNSNIYKKTQIVLLILIVIALATLVVTIVRKNNTEKYITEEAMTNLMDNTESLPQQEEEFIEEEQEEDTSWDEENVEDTKVDMNQEQNAEENNPYKYYIKINYTANCITIYEKDASGKYTVPVKAIVCSTGKATPTSGVYKISNKYRWHQLNGGVYGQYCSRITGHILFHSVPYSTNSPDSLKYTAYDKLGTKASAGCIRLTVADAIWIYNNCASGTYVEFYSSSNPGPLGKPSAQKISSNVTCRNWDPTDPLEANPWKNYVEPASTTVETPTPSMQTETPSQNIPIQQEPTNKTQEEPYNSSSEETKKDETQEEENTVLGTEDGDEEEPNKDEENSSINDKNNAD